MPIFGNPDILLEKYVGGNHKEFRIIEAELAKLITMIRKHLKPLIGRVDHDAFQSHQVINSIPSGLDINILNNSDHTKMIEKMFMKFFGLKNFFLTWDISSQPNAYTLCKSFIFLDRNFKREESGHRTNNKLAIGVVLHTGLVTYSNLNEKEIMAILLHEIGHNFYQSIYHVLANLPLSLKDLMPWDTQRFSVLPSIGNVLLTMGIRDIFNMPSILISGKKAFDNLLHKYFPGIMKVINTYKDFIYNLQSLFLHELDISKVYHIIASGGTITFNNIFLYNVEKHADSFAADYGYGQHLATALDKLTSQENSLRGYVTNIPGLNWIYDLYDLQMELLLRPFIGYPSKQNRIRTILDRLRRSAKDQSLDPRVCKELEKDIVAYEDYYNNVYLNLEKNNNKKKIFSWAFANMVETVFAGKMDLRELVHALDPEKYR